MFKTTALNNVANKYVDNDIPGAVPGTRIEADDQNIKQDELVNAVEGQGYTIDPTGVKRDQVNKAISLFYDNEKNYVLGEIAIGSDKNRYQCLIVNGPATSVVDPVSDDTGTWTIIMALTRLIKTSSGSWDVPDGYNGKVRFMLGAAGGGAAGGDSFQTGTTSTAGSKGGDSVLSGPGGLSMTAIGGEAGLESTSASKTDHGGGAGDGATLIGKGSPGGVEAGMSADPGVSATGNFATGGANGGLQIYEVDLAAGDTINFTIGAGGTKGIGNPTTDLDGTDGVDGYLIIEYGG